MQARAIFAAAATMIRDGRAVMVEIMIPLIIDKPELDMLKAIVDRAAEQVEAEEDISLSYLVGTMIELPRACLRAGAIAETAEFFSFGTNDLTQTTYGFSRDDATPFLDVYQAKGVLSEDPFMTIDTVGVGELVRIGCERGRRSRPDLKLGICGEHGGDPASIRFFHDVGLDYVSCSPYRVPIARLAAAQAVINEDAPESPE
jgi:pyruvate,orthophosphate dikinase